MTVKKKNTGFLGFIEQHEKGLLEAGAGILAFTGIGEIGAAAVVAGVGIAKLISHKSPKTKQTTKTNTNASTSSSTSTIPFGKINPYTGAYMYNAPMVKDAYFNPTPTITDDGIFGQVDLQAYQNAKNAWTTQGGKINAAKGAIQMDRWLWKSSAGMAAVNALKKQGRSVPKDLNGFKFLYNPQTVNMTWGQSTFTNNQALLQGLDQIVPAAPGSTNSSITFWIPLNRIQDMNYINPDGSYVSNNPSGPYAYGVSQSERKAIYEKGTMYDIEWLMKTINGWAFLDHTSDVSGLKTNDMGFLLQFPVELHLGNSLRYRVQITDITVQHIIFNSRMIPIWSTLNITCRRFPEYNFSDISKAVSQGGS